MANTRFFTNAGPFSLAELAGAVDAELVAEDAARLVRDVATLDKAGPDDIGFLDNRKYADAFAKSGAGACIVRPEMKATARAGMALLLTKDPYRAYARIAAKFYPTPAPEPWVAPTACIHPTAIVAADARIEPGAFIDRDTRIGSRTTIGANAVIGRGVEIGQDTVIGAHVTVSHATIGNRVTLYPGVRIGQDGFGYAMGAAGHLKVPQLGQVVIEDDVEIGANSTVDRGAGPDTVIGMGTKIDNLVQIAHNVHIGRCCVIVSQAGVAGSSELGDFVIVGGQVGIIGHLKIGTGARIAGQSGVTRDVAPGHTVAGAPAVSRVEWLRQAAILSRLSRGKGGGKGEA